MTERPDGGAAFPVELPGGRVDQGMSLRDYFAAQAMVGLMINVDALAEVVAAAPSKVKKTSLMAAMAYAVAEAMLKAREQ